MIRLSAMPDVVPGDDRITALHRAFGLSVFSADDAAPVLGLDRWDAWALLFHDDLVDHRYRVAINNGKFWLIPRNPMHAAATVLWGHHRHHFRDGALSNVQFAYATKLPIASANWVLSTLVAAKFLSVNMSSQGVEGGSITATYYVTPGQKRVLRVVEPEPEPRRRVIWKTD